MREHICIAYRGEVNKENDACKSFLGTDPTLVKHRVRQGTVSQDDPFRNEDQFSTPPGCSQLRLLHTKMCVRLPVENYPYLHRLKSSRLMDTDSKFLTHRSPETTQGSSSLSSATMQVYMRIPPTH